MLSDEVKQSAERVTHNRRQGTGERRHSEIGLSVVNREKTGKRLCNQCQHTEGREIYRRVQG